MTAHSSTMLFTIYQSARRHNALNNSYLANSASGPRVTCFYLPFLCKIIVLTVCTCVMLNTKKNRILTKQYIYGDRMFWATDTDHFPKSVNCWFLRLKHDALN